MSATLESFRRIRGDRLVELFYSYLLGTNEAIRALFAHTKMEQQRQMAQHGILMMLDCAAGKAVGKLAVRRLGRLHHVEVGVSDDMYTTFVDCLVRAASELDPQWSPRLERAWRTDLGEAIKVMKSYADS